MGDTEKCGDFLEELKLESDLGSGRALSLSTHTREPIVLVFLSLKWGGSASLSGNWEG